MDKRKLELVTDFYEFTMSNGFFSKNMSNTIAYFDVFFREIPDHGGYVIFAGLEQIIDYIKNLEFDDEDINYLKSKNIFSVEFLEYLRNFKFSGTIWAIPEGTVVFPNEPLITVKAPIIEAQLLETAMLCLINHQSLIATKSSRIVNAAKGRPVMEFGARRAHSIDAAVFGARAAIIGGCVRYFLYTYCKRMEYYCKSELWLIVLFKHLILNMKHLKLMLKIILMIVLFL